MPIDPSIALGVRPAQVPDLLEAYSRGVTLKNLMLQQRQQQEMAPLQMQAAQQQLESGNLEMQQRRQQLSQTQAVNAAYSGALTVGADGTPDLDTGKLTHALATAGHGAAIPGILKGITDMQKSRADLHEVVGKVAAAQQDFAGSIGSAVQAAKNDPFLFLTLSKHAAATQSVDPKLVESFTAPVQKALEEDPSGESARQIVGQIAAHLVAASPAQQKLINERTTADSRAATARTSQARLDAELPGIQANNQIKGLEAAAQTAPNNQDDWTAWRAGLPAAIQAKVPAFFSPASREIVRGMAISPYQQKELEGQAQGRQNQATHNTAIEGFERQRVGIATQEQKLRQQTFDATYGALNGPDGKPLDPDAAKAVAQQDPLAVAIANYQKAPMPGGSRGPAAGIMRKVMYINPEYNEQNWAQQKTTLLDYSPAGKTGIALGKMSTALGHLGVLDQAAEALKNGNLPLLNAIGNRLGVATGGTAVTTFQTIVHRLGPEIEGAYLAGGGTAGERGTTEKDFDANGGYQQIKNNIATSAKLFRSKIATSEYQWSQVMGKRPMPFLLSPEAQHTMQQLGGGTESGGGRGGSPDAPPLPTVFSPGDLGKTFTNRQGQMVKITDLDPKDKKRYQFVVVGK